MNTLCHLVIGHPDPDVMLGQFLGDFVKGPVSDTPYSQRVRQGIQAHRRIDASGDRHSFTRFAKSTLPERHRRFAGVVLDVYSDHLLLNAWEDLVEAPLQSTLDCFYGCLEELPENAPASASRTAGVMVSYRLLEATGDPRNLSEILRRIGTRLRRPPPFQEVLERFQEQEEGFQKRFSDYFRDMQREAAQTG
jgi:acyl carrier protein phosphodiesterase